MIRNLMSAMRMYLLVLLMLHADTFMNVNEIYNIVPQDASWYICGSL